MTRVPPGILLTPVTQSAAREDFFLLGDAEATWDGGIGGWGEVARARRLAFSEWDGTPLRTLIVPILIDGWPNREITADIINLENFGVPGGPGLEPPVIRITGPVHHHGLAWVLNKIEWGTGEYDGQIRVRQAANLNFMQYNPASTVDLSSVGKRNASTKSPVRYYTVKRGETLSHIASKLYHNTQWRKIADANDIRDPNNLSKYVGKKIRIP